VKSCLDFELSKGYLVVQATLSLKKCMSSGILLARLCSDRAVLVKRER